MIILFLIKINFVFGQIINIPDLNFKNTLLSTSIFTSIAGQGWNDNIGNSTSNLKIDENDDGEIQVNEALLVSRLDLHNCLIANTEGLQFFINLKMLNFTGNLFTTINVSSLTGLKQLTFSLSKLTSLNVSGLFDLVFLSISGEQLISIVLNDLPNLKFLACGNSNLSTLNLDGLTTLETITCFNSQLTSLDLSGLPNLKAITCNDNQLTSLNFSNNPNFERLICYNNNLSYINLKNGKNQTFDNNNIADYCWSGNPNLINICADESEMVTIVNFQYLCNSAQPLNIFSDCSLNTKENNFFKTYFYPNPSSGIFNIDLSSNKENFELISIFDILGKTIYHENIRNIKKLSIDLTAFQSGFYFAKFSNDIQSTSIQLIKI